MSEEEEMETRVAEVALGVITGEVAVVGSEDIAGAVVAGTGIVDSVEERVVKVSFSVAEVLASEVADALTLAAPELAATPWPNDWGVSPSIISLPESTVSSLPSSLAEAFVALLIEASSSTPSPLTFLKCA